MKRFLALLLTALTLLLTLTGCKPQQQTTVPEKTEITFADVGWDSIRLHNAIAGLVAESVFGYTWTEVPGSTPITHEALLKGEVDINMEEWSNNIPSYYPDLEAGKFQELGINFDDNFQGFYIPRYVADQYPELRTVQDLKDFAWLFPDPEDPNKARIYGGIPGWEITEIMRKKVETYGLDEFYNYVVPGSDAAMNTTLVSAWDKQEPVVAYYWEPTWLMGKYDFVLLEDIPYNEETYQAGIGACPAVTVTVGVSNQFAQSNPDFCAFLSKYRTSSALTSEGLAYMQETGANYNQAARWFLQQHPEFIDQWFPDSQQAARLRQSVQGEGGSAAAGGSWLSSFPVVIEPNTEAIDNAVRGFAVWASPVLDAIKAGLNGLVNAFNWLLGYIPWFVLLAAVFLLGWRSRKSVKKGILYTLLFSVIGFLGLWELMKLTLSIVMASMCIALLLGLPIGILISNSERANSVMRPILDTMQTMPVFVYLIPALLLFGMGNASAVIATVIYAVVPVIRLTSLGIRQVDKEVVEAARSFGSTKWQALFKVQIPQALPTIMTGVNQTLMMAMAMVVTCSMIGARGLGMEVLNAVNRIEIGRGLIAGAVVVILAVVLDRLTQGWFSKDKKPTGKKPKVKAKDRKGGKDSV